jgi:hypothetical protein
MNESDFEKRLHALQPAAPSSELIERIQEELAEPNAIETSRHHPRSVRLADAVRRILALRLVHDFGWACAGAAAAVAVIANFHHPNAPVARLVEASVPMAEPDAFEHAETTRELVSTEDSGELFETEEGPARQVRYSYLEHHAWANPRTGARVEIEVPREDVFLLPVSMQ